jgi:DNA-directed RNA polymerase subunit RPC12/RpoP
LYGKKVWRFAMIEFKCSECGKQLKVQDNAAGKRGKCPQCGAYLLVQDLEMVTLEMVEPSSLTLPQSSRVAGSTDEDTPSPGKQKHRQWVPLLIVGAIVAIPFVPKFPLWFGIVLLVLCVMYFIPVLQSVSRKLLRLNPREKWRSGFRLTMYGLIGLALIIAGRASIEIKAELEKSTAMQAAEEAEQQRLVNEANNQVISLVSEAETAWRQGNFALVKVKLEKAKKTPHATNLIPIRKLRTLMANAEVELLMTEAISAVKAGDIDTSKEKIRAAFAVPHANALAETKKLNEQINNATDPTYIRGILMELPEKAFQQLYKNGKMPVQFVSGYEGLDRRTADLAKSQLGDIAATREHQHQEQLKQERIAEESAQNAERERRAMEAEATEAKRKNVQLELNVTELPERRVKLYGTTNLPAGTKLMLSVTETVANGFAGQSKLSVQADGSFSFESFGPKNGLHDGIYIAEALMPVPFVQPESVQKIIGRNGENLSGSLVKQGKIGITVSVKKEFSIGGKAAADQQQSRKSNAEKTVKKMKLALCVQLKILLQIKDKEDFKTFGFGKGGPYHKWLTDSEALKRNIKSTNYIPLALKIASGDLIQLGVEYMQNKGNDTNYTKQILPELQNTIGYSRYQKNK